MVSFRQTPGVQRSTRRLAHVSELALLGCGHVFAAPCGCHLRWACSAKQHQETISLWTYHHVCMTLLFEIDPGVVLRDCVAVYSRVQCWLTSRSSRQKILRPSNSEPCSVRIAFCASSGVANSTRPQPLDRPFAPITLQKFTVPAVRMWSCRPAPHHQQVHGCVDSRIRASGDHYSTHRSRIINAGTRAHLQILPACRPAQVPDVHSLPLVGRRRSTPCRARRRLLLAGLRLRRARAARAEQHWISRTRGVRHAEPERCASHVAAAPF